MSLFKKMGLTTGIVLLTPLYLMVCSDSILGAASAANKNGSKMSVSLPREAQEILKKRNPDDHLISACIGSFSIEGEDEYAATSFNPQNKVITLHAFLKGARQSYQHIEIANRHDQKSPEEGVRCLSAMEVKRMNKTIEHTDAGHIKSKSRFDTICFGNDAEQHCYEFDLGKREFVDVGGWAN